MRAYVNRKSCGRRFFSEEGAPAVQGFRGILDGNKSLGSREEAQTRLDWRTTKKLGA
jgi:hypothetical protein